MDEKTRKIIVKSVEKNRDSIINMLQEMLKIPSVNPWFGDPKQLSGEERVQQFLKKQLENLGASKIDMWEPNAKHLSHRSDGPGYYPDRDFSGRPDLVAVFEGSDPQGKDFMIQGHCDVVQTSKGWIHDPYSGECIDGEIYGRGAVDMKGGMVSAIGAIKALKYAGFHFRQNLIVASVCDEEAGGMGTLSLVDRGYRAPGGAIVPEATEMNIAPLCRGILWGRITFMGRSGHIELKQKSWKEGGAVDAIAIGRKFLDRVDRLNAEWAKNPLKNHKYLPLPCQFLVAQIDAGEYPTSFAQTSKITFDAQYLPVQKDAHGLGSNVKREIEDFVKEFASEYEWLRLNPPEIEWLVDADCGETSDSEPVVIRTLANARYLGIESSIQGCMSHTDMGIQIDDGTPTINFGPGMMGLAHQVNEHLSVEDLIKATKVFALTIADLCGIE